MRHRAPAKINLYLHVLGQRADGYHLLDSLVVFAGIADDVEVSAASSLTLAVEGPFGAALATLDWEDNLVVRAARRLARHRNIPGHAALRLYKRLPVAAGIGGGSADAAATLHALDQFWGLEVPPNELAGLGVELGADVPACLYGRPLYLGAAGEETEPAPDVPALPLVLVGPDAPLETARVFATLQGTRSAPARLEPMDRQPAVFARALGQRRNDLEAPARRLVPVIDQALTALAAAGGCLLARMSGSGPVCFGIFAGIVAAEDAAGEIAARYPRWWVTATMTGAA